MRSTLPVGRVSNQDSSIYNSIQPLREEVEQLEKDAAVANEQKDKLESEVAQRNHPLQAISLNMPLSSETLKLWNEKWRPSQQR